MSAWWPSPCEQTALSTTDATGTSAWVRQPAGTSVDPPALPPCTDRLNLILHSLVAGMKLANLSKILKCAGNDDAITMKSEDNGDTITFMFESPSA
jgi:hypothetical protein